MEVSHFLRAVDIFKFNSNAKCDLPSKDTLRYVAPSSHNSFIYFVKLTFSYYFAEYSTKRTTVCTITDIQVVKESS